MHNSSMYGNPLKPPFFGLAINNVNNDDNNTSEVALCFEITTDGQMVRLLPPGENVVGEDGRSWLNNRTDAIVDYFNKRIQNGKQLLFDYNHASELKAPNGDEAPASGWGVTMEVKGDGSVWTNVDWTERAKNAIDNKEYRYVSPVLIFNKATKSIVGIKNVALTNSPNLEQIALNHSIKTKTENNDMPLDKKLADALGLDANASVDDAVTAVDGLKTDRQTALNQAQMPSLDKFVPRSDFDKVNKERDTLQTALNAQQKEKTEAEIDTAINQALEDGKIAPASKDYYTDMCATEGGLDKFKTFVKTSPVIAEASNIKGKPKSDTGTALNAEEKYACEQLGMSEEDYMKSKGDK